MSKIKSPPEKKAQSLKRDRRNTYGENPKASRKGIRRGKQRSHMDERRAIGSILERLRTNTDEGFALEADVLAKETSLQSKHDSFRKTPDRPLGIVIQEKLKRRERLRQSGVKEAPRVYANLYSDEIFDVPYDAALHKRQILRHLRYHLSVRGWAQRKSKRTKYQRNNAVRWKEAILRDAPLLRGFFDEEPQWRERVLRWCEKALSSE